MDSAPGNRAARQTREGPAIPMERYTCIEFGGVFGGAHLPGFLVSGCSRPTFQLVLLPGSAVLSRDYTSYILSLCIDGFISVGLGRARTGGHSELAAVGPGRRTDGSKGALKAVLA